MPTESIALRSFSILELIARSPNPLSQYEIADACELPRATTFRILNMLEDAGLLRREASSRRYTVGARLSAFALDMWHQSTMRKQWSQYLQAAVDVCGESCNLTILEGDKVLYLDRVETDRPLRLHLEPGTRVPLYCTASGKLFLCQLDESDVRKLLGPEPFERFTDKTITNYDKLFKELAKVRNTLVGTYDSELFDDSVAIATPLVDSTGRIYAAIAVHAPLSRVSLKDCMRFLPTLEKTAASIATTMAAPSKVPDDNKKKRDHKI